MNGRNALALYARALDLATKSASSSTIPDTSETAPRLNVSAGQVKTLCNALQGLVWKYRGLVEMQKLSAADGAGSKDSFRPPLIESMDEYPSGEVDLANLVTYPPKIQPVPVKPLFLDVAWNYIDYPQPGSKTAAAAASAAQGAANPPATEKKEGKRGWFGFGR